MVFDRILDDVLGDTYRQAKWGVRMALMILGGILLGILWLAT